MKTAIRQLSILALAVGLSSVAHAAQIYSYTGPLTIPDAIEGAEPTGVSVPFSISGVDSFITDIKVTLNISGTGGAPGYTGDLYVTLKNLDANGGQGLTSVLLNRVGNGSYNTAGFNMTLTSGIAPDIHDYQQIATDKDYTDETSPFSGQLTGTWSADGRINPGAGASSDARPATLDVLNGINPNGNWSLFLADYGAGIQMQINSFSVDVELEAVPEPAQTAVAVGGLLFGLALYRKPAVRARLASLVGR